MTKREKILLQICIAIGLIGLGSMYLLRPAIVQKNEAEMQLEEAQMQEMQIMTILNTPGVEETLEEQKALAEENYKYFYDKLNSYTIDEILNELVADCGLEIESMNISEYTKVDINTLRRVEEEMIAQEDNLSQENEAFLLGCRVSFRINGDYDNYMKLLSVLKKESTCIEVVAVNAQTDARNVTEEQSIQATIELLVYGIEDVMVEGKDA